MEFSVSGFKASGIAAGIKKENIPDLALIFSEYDSVAAGVFTTNKVKAAPVLLTEDHIMDRWARIIIANSGNANACTGPIGIKDARSIAELIAKELDVRADEVLVASTGVIGASLPMDTIARAIPELVSEMSEGGIAAAAEAIMTTDSFPKISSIDGEAGGQPYRITGISKGAGMIMPNMATMLCFVITDINISGTLLQNALLSSNEVSFNRITVDGDTSTNDMVLVMANGAAGNKNLTTEEYDDFVMALKKVMTDLALMIIRDGEGATKVVHVKVRGAASEEGALKCARTIANSSLVKTAFYGQDPNWGRVMAALGRSGIMIREEDVSIWIDDVQIVGGGLGLGKDLEEKAADKMKNSEFSLIVDLNQGEYEDFIVTSDLTHEYVSINADYRT
jgi:glutamate N-acetyltransferase/amino-acid N-acetyltransferase